MADQFAPALRRFRTRAALTQEALAERSGVSVSTIRGFETGRRSNPQLGTVRQLADALSLSPADREELLSAAVGVATQAPPTPRQLPAAPRWFTGRSAALAALDEALPQPGTAVVSGSGGIGKSALAVQWAYRNADRFPDGQLFVNLRGFDPSGSPVAPTTALHGFLHALGVDREAIPPQLDAQSSMFRSLTADRRMLVVLDNAADAEQVAPLLPGRGCTAVVTSRHRLAALVTGHGAGPVFVDALPEDEARALLAERLGADRVAAEPAAVDDLVAHCAGLPLALSVVAGRAQARPTFALAAFAAQLQDVATRLGELNDDDGRASVRAVLSWSTSALTDEQVRMFALLGTAPGPDVSVSSAACLADLVPHQASTVLRTLERVSLLQEHQPGRYRMYDLVRLHAAELDVSPAERRASVTRLATMHAHIAESAARMLRPFRRPSLLGPVEPSRHARVPSSLDDAWTWFHTERACLRATMQAAADNGLHGHVWQLARHLGSFFDRAGFLQETVDLWRLALSAAHHLDHPAALTEALLALGHHCSLVGQHEEAQRHLDSALTRAIAEGDTMEEAIVRNAMSINSSLQDDIPAAIDHARRSYELFRDLNSEVFEAQSLAQYGWLTARTGEYATARKACEAALAVFQAHDDKDSQVVVTHTLAYLARATGRLTDARDLHQKECDLARQIRSTRREATATESLGETHAALGDIAAARTTWERTVHLLREQQRHTEAERVENLLKAL